MDGQGIMNDQTSNLLHVPNEFTQFGGYDWCFYIGEDGGLNDHLLPTTEFKACDGYEYDVDISVTDYQESDGRQPCIVMVCLGHHLRIIERVHFIYHDVYIYSDLLEDGQTVFICTPCLPVGVVVLDCGLLFGHKIIYLQIMHILSTSILSKFKLLLCLFLA